MIAQTHTPSSTNQATYILLIEDNPGDAFLVKEYLGSPFEALVRHVESLHAGLTMLKKKVPGLIIIDLALPDAIGLSGVKALHAVYNGPLIVLTGLNDERLALDSLKEGAQDFLVKDEINSDILSRSIVYAIERHQTAQTLLDAERRQQALEIQINNERLISEAMSNIAHEFRTPLATIRTSAEIMSLSSDHKMLERHKNHINNSVDLLLKISEYMSMSTSLSFIQNQKKVASVDLALKSAVNKLCSFDDRLHISGDVAENLSMSPNHLEELLYQLIDNSIRFSPPQSPVEIAVKRLGAQVNITIQNEGSGIEEKELTNIFLPFYKVCKARTKNTGEGPGLGLSTANLIVQAYGGTISVKSEPDQKTAFTVILPATSHYEDRFLLA